MAVKNVTFQVTANASQATQELAKVARGLELIQKKANIKVTVDTTQASGRINNLNSAITQLSKKAVSLKVDTKGATAEIKKVTDALTKAEKKTSINVQAQTSSARSALQGILNLINKLKQRVTITVNTTALNNANRQINNVTQPRQVNFRTNASQAKQQVGGLSGTIDSVSQAVANSSNNFVRLRNVIARTGLALSGVAIGAAITSLGRAAINAAKDYEVLKVAFTTFIGNASLAEVKIKQLRQFAAETPFTVDEVFKASRTLLGYGVAANELIPIIKRLGDVAGGTGAPLERIALVFGQVRAAGRLYGQDLLQLINAGFNPLQEISRTTGKSFGQLKDEMRKGLVTFEQVNNAFITATSEGGKFFNLTNALANTTQGRLARLSESWSELLRIIGDGLLPTFNTLVIGLSRVLTAFKELPEYIEKNKFLILSLTAATALFIGARTKANQANILAAITTAADNVVERIANGLYRIKTVLLANTTRATVGMTIAQRAQTVATNGATIAQNAFNAAVRANPIGVILTLLALATAAWYGYSDAVGEATQDWIDLNDVTSKAEAQANKAATERINLVNQEINAIKATKTGTKERQDLIDKFNEKNKPAQKLKDIADEALFIKTLDAAYGQLNETIKRQEMGVALTAGKGELEAQKTQQIEKVLKAAKDVKVEIPIELLTRPTDIEGKLQGAKDLLLNEQKNINAEIKRIQGLSEKEIIAQAEDLKAKGIRVTQTQRGKENFVFEADITGLEKQAAAITDKVIPSIEDLNKTYTDIAGVQLELNPLETILQYDPAAEDAKLDAEKKRIEKYKEYLNEYFSLQDRIKKNNEELRKQRIEFRFIDEKDYELEIEKLKQLDKINEEAVNREIDREIAAVRAKELTEEQKSSLIGQLEVIRFQEQEKRANDYQQRIYEIERDGIQARIKLFNDAARIQESFLDAQLQRELDNLDKIRDGLDEYYNDIFENYQKRGKFITLPRIEFGGTQFQFEDLQVELEQLKKDLLDLDAFAQGDGISGVFSDEKLKLINAFNDKYKTSIKL
ncbi:tape measure protein, partial [Patescibacteria group bacterium]|nr:tape measure protein [Patescibacteria group bacterium]